ncbi:hypothetical protein INT45_011352 [Circinella minor]|uniref:Uncharacterized protein n=1 Tax=Circinella minor TaxID=1195481 RepID=A0A8H7S0M8_9FUNG|nr:hypothetical protein INT45_011352 [Circinella minor]
MTPLVVNNLQHFGSYPKLRQMPSPGGGGRTIMLLSSLLGHWLCEEGALMSKDFRSHDTTCREQLAALWELSWASTNALSRWWWLCKDEGHGYADQKVKKVLSCRRILEAMTPLVVNNMQHFGSYPELRQMPSPGGGGCKIILLSSLLGHLAVFVDCTCLLMFIVITT